jgi:hypothetical protein
MCRRGFWHAACPGHGPLASIFRRPGLTFVDTSQTFRPSEGSGPQEGPFYVIITRAHHGNGGWGALPCKEPSQFVYPFFNE